MRRKTKIVLIIILSVLLAGELAFAAWLSYNEITPEVTVPPTIPQVTDAATTPPTEEPTDPPTEAPTEPPIVLHSGLREDGTFGEGAMLIGDSLTYGLVSNYLTNNQKLGDAMYMAMPGKGISAFFNGIRLKKKGDEIHLYNKEFEGLPMDDVVAQFGEKITAVYFMMGTNASAVDCPEEYIKIVDYILEHCPDATVYLQLVPHSRKAFIKYEQANQNIRTAYEHYQQSGNPKVMLIDTYTAIGENLNVDGIHLTEQGQECWYNAIVAFAQENNIPQ